MTALTARTVLAWVPDLMDRSRFGARVLFVSDPSDLVGPADLVLIDLARLPDLAVISTIAAPTIGFAPHVDGDLAEAARTAGCDEVLARSVFFRRLGQILSDY